MKNGNYNNNNKYNNRNETLVSTYYSNDNQVEKTDSHENK